MSTDDDRFADVPGRLVEVRNRLASCGGSDVAILAVTKGFDRTAVDAAARVGLLDVGENYADELVAKAADTPGVMRWHFIGRLQSNKIKLVAPYVSVWQSVDRLKLGRAIARYQPGATVYVQIRPPALDADTDKGGARVEDVPALVGDLASLGLTVDGVMTVGVAGDDEATRDAFEAAVEVADVLGLAQRSMGMSGDIELAVAAGSTMVRIGSALFGPRPPRRPA